MLNYSEINQLMDEKLKKRVQRRTRGRFWLYLKQSLV